MQAHHLYQSKFLVDTLHEMGFSSSDKEVVHFEKSAADSIAADMLVDDIGLLDMALLLARDSAHHHILTIDGKGTFHGMGIIEALTHGQKKDHVTPRRNIANFDFSVKSKIPLTEYSFAKHVSHTITFEQLPALVSRDKTIDVLWKLSLNIKQETPGWQGMTHNNHQGLEHPDQLPITFLTMINYD